MRNSETRQPFTPVPRNPVMRPPAKSMVTVPGTKLIGIFAAVDGDSKKLVKYYGPELVTNGTFDFDGEWSLGLNWTISGGKLVNYGLAGSYTTQIILGLVPGKLYKLSLDASNYYMGETYFYAVGITPVIVNGDGSFSCEGIFSSPDNNNLYMGNYLISDFRIDNVSCREILYRETDE